MNTDNLTIAELSALTRSLRKAVTLPGVVTVAPCLATEQVKFALALSAAAVAREV